VPQLAGKLIEAKPRAGRANCWWLFPKRVRSRNRSPEIQLRLGKPLAGKPAIGADFQ
jgi:hypothetical protein